MFPCFDRQRCDNLFLKMKAQFVVVFFVFGFLCVNQSSQYEFLTGFYYYSMFNFFHWFIDHLEYKKSVQKVSLDYFKGEHCKNKIQTNKPKQNI